MKTWFITGASRGFGRRIAQLALAQGDNVVATARNAATVRDTLGDNSRLLALPLDVTNDEQARAAAASAIEKFGGIDVLLNNAGFGLLGAVEEATTEEVERLYRTNVFGLLSVTRAVLPYMRAQRSGRIINISSIGGYRSSAGFGVYCSSLSPMPPIPLYGCHSAATRSQPSKPNMPRMLRFSRNGGPFRSRLTLSHPLRPEGAAILSDAIRCTYEDGYGDGSLLPSTRGHYPAKVDP
jgi:nucleoside-diphosphate-sugar epimerase